MVWSPPSVSENLPHLRVANAPPIFGTPRSSLENSNPTNLSSDLDANLLETSSCPSASMWTLKSPLALSALCVPVTFSTETITSGGSRETEQNAETVIPKIFPARSVEVTTVTPLANFESVFRNWSALTGMTVIFSHENGDASLPAARG